MYFLFQFNDEQYAETLNVLNEIYIENLEEFRKLTLKESLSKKQRKRYLELKDRSDAMVRARNMASMIANTVKDRR